jgi:hypothetical protein
MIHTNRERERERERERAAMLCNVPNGLFSAVDAHSPEIRVDIQCSHLSALNIQGDPKVLTRF